MAPSANPSANTEPTSKIPSKAGDFVPSLEIDRGTRFLRGAFARDAAQTQLETGTPQIAADRVQKERLGLVTRTREHRRTCATGIHGHEHDQVRGYVYTPGQLVLPHAAVDTYRFC